MKIGIVCPYNMMHPGGVQECVGAMHKELVARGHTVRIITPASREYKGKTPKDTLFIGQSKRVRTPQRTTPDIAISVDTAVIDRVLAEEQFDVVHIHEPLVPFLPLQMLGRITVPVVGTFHASMPETILAKTIAGSIGPYVRSILRRLTVITAVSPPATSYIDHYEHQPVNFIPNGIDLDFYKPGVTAPKKQTNTILYVGRLEGRKGVKYLLHAYKALREQHHDAELIIAGDGTDRKKLEKCAHDLKLTHIHFLGQVTQSKKLQLLRRATLFCSPALFGESFGIVLLEAMAVGIPVVAGNNAGYRAVLEGQGQTSLVDCEDVPALTAQLELFIYDQRVRDTWQHWAKRYVKQFSYAQVVDQYERAYKQAIDSTKQ